MTEAGKAAKKLNTMAKSMQAMSETLKKMKRKKINTSWDKKKKILIHYLKIFLFLFCVSYIYILNTHLCTFWYKFSFLQGDPGKWVLDDGGVRFGGHSHFPDCLVLNEGGHGITEMTPPFKRFRFRSSLSFSVVTTGERR